MRFTCLRLTVGFRFLQNDEIAPHVASPEDSARHDSFVSTPTEVSRDEGWATRSIAASSTAGDGVAGGH